MTAGCDVRPQRSIHRPSFSFEPQGDLDGNPYWKRAVSVYGTTPFTPTRPDRDRHSALVDDPAVLDADAWCHWASVSDAPG